MATEETELGMLLKLLKNICFVTTTARQPASWSVKICMIVKAV